MLQTHLQTHFKGNNTEDGVTNPVFERTFIQRKSRVRPIRQIISKAKLSLANQSYECKFCGRTFQKGSAMKMHIDKTHVTNVKKEVRDDFTHSSN